MNTSSNGNLDIIIDNENNIQHDSADNINDNEMDSMNNMTEREKRMFQLRLKINQGRKANKSDVEEEFKRFTEPVKKQFGGKSRRVEENDSVPEIDIPNNSILNVTASDSIKWQEIKNKKDQNQATFGWQAYTSEASFRSYEKSLKKLPTRAANKESNVSLEDQLLSKQNVSTEITQSALDKLGKELENKEKERLKYSRRRMHFESSDIDYINDDNAKFNKKIKKAFNPYTVEIRQNLERGTAV